MDLKIDPAALQTIVSDALLRQLDANARETLIKSAITHLMTPRPPAYAGDNDRRTPLEQAFDIASTAIAREIIRAEMEKPAVRDVIAGAVNKAFARALADHDGLIEAMTQSIQRAIRFRD